MASRWANQTLFLSTFHRARRARSATQTHIVRTDRNEHRRFADTSTVTCRTWTSLDVGVGVSQARSPWVSTATTCQTMSSGRRWAGDKPEAGQRTGVVICHLDSRNRQEQTQRAGKRDVLGREAPGQHQEMWNSLVHSGQLSGRSSPPLVVNTLSSGHGMQGRGRRRAAK